MRVRSSRFVGRGDELALLGRWLDEAREGQPRVVIVGGEAGVGKSRLVSELGRLAQERGAAWLIGASADFGAGGLPFEALVGALRPVISDARLAARLGPARAELAALFPSLGGPRASGATDGLSQLRLLEALLALLEHVAHERPSVLVLEDLHWADASTRDFLAFLARNLGTLPLLVVVTFRSDDVGRGHPLRRYLAELGRVSGVEHLDLSRLGEGEVRELAEAIRGEPVDEALLSQLYERSQGNPYFSEELLAAAQSTGTASALPASLREILLARVEMLAPHTRTVLAAASVLGTAGEELLATVTGLGPQELAEALREAIDRYVLELSSSGDGAAAYAFRHALAREVVYADLLPGERARLHERAAQALSADTGAGEPADPQHLSRLAHHWRQTGRPLEAFRASWRAAEAAERAYANAEAGLHFEHVLELWDQVEDPQQLLSADRADVLLRAGSAAHLANDQSRASALLRSAVDRIDAQLEPDRAAQARQVLLGSLVMGGMADEAREVKDQLDDLVDACSPATRLHLLTDFMWYFEHYGDLAQSLELSGEALAQAESVGDERDRALLHSRAGRSRAFLEGAGAGLAELELARSIAAAAGDDNMVGGIDKDIGIVLQSAGRFAEAIEAFERSQRLLEPLGMRVASRHTDAEIAFALHRLGRWREADAAIERALTPPVTEWSYAVRAYVLAATGRLEEARRELKRAWPSVEASQAPPPMGPTSLRRRPRTSGKAERPRPWTRRRRACAWSGRRATTAGSASCAPSESGRRPMQDGWPGHAPKHCWPTCASERGRRSPRARSSRSRCVHRWPPPRPR
ncbi:MAG TPA: AAA family ATPase [Candidatus Limnocylindria bacterium]|nr:AAA family ATPase [Candidatus Limnocylindria bacterium]